MFLTVLNNNINENNTEIIAVIVTMIPDNRLVENVSKIDSLVDEIIIIDNTPNRIEDSIYDYLCSNPKILFIKNENNVGLGKSLNIGVKWALREKCRWVIFFDQDSIIREDFFQNIFSQSKECRYWDKVGIIAPLYIDQETSYVKTFGYSDVECKLRKTNFVPTSGSMIRREVFESIGFFREEFFIDYIDYDFCFRCINEGWIIVQNEKAVLYHSVGKPAYRNLLWIKVIPSNHTPERIYYRTRNRIILYSCYFNNYKAWIIKDIYQFFKEVIKIILFEKHKINKMLKIIKGIKHALKGKMGEYA